MAETLRELVVSLSLNSDNFNANLKSVNQRIREAESNFKLASAGIDGFGNTMNGAATQFSALKQKLEQQNKAVEQHERKLQAANKALDKSRDSVSKQASSLDESKRAHTALTAEIAKAEAAYKASAKATGENSEQTVALGVKVLDLKDKQKGLADEIKNGEAKLEAETKSVQRNEDAVSKAQTGLNNAKAEVKETTSALDKLSSGLGKAGAALGVLAGKAVQAGESMSAMGKKLSTRVTAPLAALGAYAFKAAVDFESAFAGVRKTVNASEEDFARLEQSVKDMSLEVPSNTTAIASVMEIAGQLGIATENLESFSRTIIDLANTTNLSAEEAATELAQFANVTGMSQGDANKFGSALVDLGNNFATTERDIMNMSTRLAAAGSQVGLSETQILGFATALSSVGLEAEAGGSAFSKVMTKMEVAVATGKNGLKDFAKVSGMSQKAFVEQWKSEPAKAIEAFIVGLSKMDEEGISAIATLEDMGLNELRLRDTLLRATNATELFSNAQATAASAWGDGSALATEANIRYETMASQLEILKNRVSLAAQSLGDEMVPMAERVIEAVSGLIDRFMALDTEQKEQIIKWAAIAAAVGPALIVLGKITSGAGKTIQAVLGVSRALKAVGSGVAGLLGPVGIAALAAAALYGAYRWIDYASGAQAAREALDGMNQTAKAWKETQAETLFDRAPGLSAFGLSDANFSADITTAEQWMNKLKAVWSDGKKETNEIVTSFSGQFRAFNDTTKSALKELSENAQRAGLSDSGVFKDLDADMKKLDDMSAELDALLKKRQNGTLTGKDKTRIQELIDAREAIEVKYNLTPADTSGFSKIVEQVDAEIARAQAEGKSGADVSVYENAVKAAAEGIAAINAQLKEQYAEEYALLQLLDDEKKGEDGLTERQRAQAELDKKHNADRIAAAQEYANTLSQVLMPAWESDGNQKAIADVEKLGQLIQQYQMAGEGGKGGILQQMKELGEGMDEGALASYLAMLTQIQELESQGLSKEEIQGLFPEIDVTSMLGGYASIAEFLKANAGDLSGLNTMFNEALPEETRRVLVELDMEAAEARWAQFEKDTAAITTVATVTPPESGIDVIINAYKPNDATLVTPPPSMVEALISAYNAAVDAGVQEPSAQVEALIKAYNESGGATVAYPSGQVEALISSYKAAVGAGVENPSGETVAYIGAYTEKTGASVALPSEAVSALIKQYNAAVDAGVQEPSAQVEAFISGYTPADGARVAVPTETVNALIGAYLASDGASVEAPDSVTAIISAYTGADNAVVPMPTTTASVTLNSLDKATIDNFVAQNQITGLTGYVGDVGLMPNAAATFKQKFESGLLALYDANGLPIPVTPHSVAALNANDIVHGVTVDDAGNATLHVQIVPEVGSPEGVELADSNLNDKPDNILPDWMKSSAADKVASIQSLAEGARELEAAGEALSAQAARSVIVDQLMSLNPDDLQNITTYIANAMAALNSGTLDPDSAAKVQEQLNAMLAVVQQADQFLGVGNDVSAGVAEGMTAYGWSGDASTLATSIETAIRAATQTQSPSQMTVPIGTGISEGIGEGITAFSFAAAGSSVRQSLLSELSNIDQTGWVIGRNFSRGLANGITSGESWIKEAARKAALAAKKAAEDALKVASPSKVGFEIGGYFTKGIALGVESEEQMRLIRNAARYLSGALQAETASSIQYDNRRTYQHQEDQSVTVNVEKLAVRDQVDIRALAMEISALKKQINRGKGG